MNRKIIIVAAIMLIMAAAAGIILYRQTDTAEPTPTTAPTDTPEPTATPEPSFFEITFFDVGEADAALVNCDGKYLLIDGGNPGDSSMLYSYLEQHNIQHIDYVVCTHAHADHVGGISGALNYATVGTAFAPVAEYDSRAFSSFVKYLAAQGKEISIPAAGDSFDLGSAAVTFLGPISASDNLNDTSLVLRIVYGETSFLFAADAERDEEIEILESGRTVRSTLLKVGHHGSETSTSLPFATAVDARYAVISVGPNDYGHPSETVLDRLAKCEIYRTDLDGTIICTSNGKELEFKTES